MLLKQLEELETPMPHGRVPKDLLLDVREILKDGDTELGYALLAAGVEYALTGMTSYDDGEHKEVMRLLRHYMRQLDENLTNYNFACEDKKLNNDLELIAQLYWRDHLKQIQIAQQLGVNQGTISRRLKEIANKYPELKQKYDSPA